MRVMVLGAGLLGVTSAYYLQQLGHEVSVVDRHPQPAHHALGGGRAPSDTAQAAMDALFRDARQAQREGPLRAGLRRWLDSLPAWMDGGPELRSDAEPGERMEGLCGFSRHTVRALRLESAVPAPRPGRSLLQYHTDARSFEAEAERHPRLQALGCDRLLLSADEAVRIEPLLRPLRPRLAGATLTLDDATGDASGFAAELLFLCRAAGVRFLRRHTVVGLRRARGRIAQVDVVDPRGEHAALQADAYVLALGPAGLRHAREAGVPLPLRFVHECTLELPARPGAALPRHALREHGPRGLWMRPIEHDGAPALEVGTQIPASVRGPATPSARDVDALRQRARALLGDGVDIEGARVRSRVRVLSAHGLPLIGRTPLPNLFLNTAPGRLGWVNACGAGKSIAHIASGIRPQAAFAFTGL